MNQMESIVLVEDDRDLRELLQEELEAEGYQVIACGDAEQGKQLLATQAVDLLARRGWPQPTAESCLVRFTASSTDHHSLWLCSASRQSATSRRG